VLIRRMVDVSWEQGQAGGWGRDISLGGMYIQGHQHPEAGADVHVTVHFRHQAALSIPAQVCRTDDAGFAVRFVALNQLVADTIRKAVEGG
jgi:hypothetical protein